MKQIVLLHGAIGSMEQLEPLAGILKEQFVVHLVNLPGHGGEPFPAGGFSMETFADAVLQYLDDNSIDTISFFGYSMGGYVALLFAKKYPQRVEKIITLATKFLWDETIAAKEIKMLQPDVIEEKLPAFAAALAKRHAPLNWKEHLMYTQQLLTGLGKQNILSVENCREISTPCLLMLGDRDKMVTLAETVEVYNTLPDAALAVLPQTSHPVEKADTCLLKFYIEHFLM